MTEDGFWAIVERVHVASGGDMDEKCKLLDAELRQLSADEIRSFHEYFSQSYYRAYTWELWDAAFIIRSGCSDDGFMDFRSCLISMGRDVFEQALADPESLADLDLNADSFMCERYGSVRVIYEEKTGRKMPGRNEHPEEPAGTQSKEWEIAKRLPKLAAKCGYEDPEWSYEQQEELRRNKKFEYALETGGESVTASGTLSDLLLDSGIIPSCGFIPPFRVVGEVLKHGEFIGASGKRCLWKSFQLDEGDFWRAVDGLEKLSPKSLKRWKNIASAKIQLDIKTPPNGDYSEWLHSLEQRGLA